MNGPVQGSCRLEEPWFIRFKVNARQIPNGMKGQTRFVKGARDEAKDFPGFRPTVAANAQDQIPGTQHEAFQMRGRDQF